VKVKPPSFTDSGGVDAVREVLSDAGYQTDIIVDYLGAVPGRIPAERFPEIEERIHSRTDKLGLMLELFFLGLTCYSDHAEKLLGQDAVRALIKCGLLRAGAGLLTPMARLSPVDNLVIASDPLKLHKEKRSDYVLAPFGVGLRLADLMFRRPIGSMLDLGCGSGMLGSLACGFADRVTLTDINPRAVAFSRFNTLLNGFGQAKCIQGDLFDSVGEERFDLIVCNPPYVISPCQTYSYRDGGIEFSSRVIKQAVPHLADDGWLQMWLEWPEYPDRDWRYEMDRQLSAAQCDGWVLRLYSQDLPTYSTIWLQQEYGGDAIPEKELITWQRYLADLGIAAVGGGLLVARRCSTKTAVRTIRDAPIISPGPIGEALELWLNAQILLNQLNEPEQLLDIPLAPAPSLKLESVMKTIRGTYGLEHRLEIENGLRFGAQVDPLMAQIVDLLKTRRTPQEALAVLVDRHQVDVSMFTRTLPKALSKLLELGILVPQQRNG